MKNRIRFTALFLIILFLTNLFSCTSDTPDETSSQITETILTNVYKGTKIAVPDGYTVHSSVHPYYDDTTGRLTILCSRERDIDRYENLLLTITADGTVTSEQTLALEEIVRRGTLAADRLYFLRTNYDYDQNTQAFYVVEVSLTDGTTTVSDDITGLFSIGSSDISANFSVNNLVLDRDGNLCINSDTMGSGEMIVLNESFEKLYALSSPLYGIRSAPDGTIYCISDDGIRPVDSAGHTLGEPVPFERPTVTGSFSWRDIWFGNGYNLFYSLEDGLYGYNFTDENSVLLIDYANADLIAGNIHVAHIFDPDHILLYEQNNSAISPVLYTRSADIDLTKIKTIEIAYVKADRDLALHMVDFNKTNDTVRIVAKDYSVYNTDENPTGGETRLINDILLGLYEPDIVAGYSTNTILQQLYKNGLCTDLYTFMETGTVSKDDLLGCVKRTFAMENGGLWGVGPLFSVDTVYGPTALLGEHTGWTLAEMLAFAHSLPEDTFLMQNFSQSRTENVMLEKTGFGGFIDPETNTCDFENDTFIDYLTYLAALPATPADANQVLSAATGIDPNDTAAITHLHQDGKIALTPGVINGHEDWIRMEAAYNTKDLTIIGYPTTDGITSGSIVGMYAYVIPTCTDAPEEAWTFVELVMHANREDRYYRDFPALKSDLLEIYDELYQTLYTITFDGSMRFGRYTDEEYAAPLSEPGIRKRFTEEDGAILLDWLDNQVGSPVAIAVDGDITAILGEEISAYLAGAKSAAECAGIIQSRVNLWLAEHQ